MVRSDHFIRITQKLPASPLISMTRLLKRLSHSTCACHSDDQICAFWQNRFMLCRNLQRQAAASICLYQHHIAIFKQGLREICGKSFDFSLFTGRSHRNQSISSLRLHMRSRCNRHPISLLSQFSRQKINQRGLSPSSHYTDQSVPVQRNMQAFCQCIAAIYHVTSLPFTHFFENTQEFSDTPTAKARWVLIYIHFQIYSKAYKTNEFL